MTDIPLTFEQRFVRTAINMWGLDPRAHHMIASVRIRGPIQVDQLTRAAVELGSAHAILRTTLGGSGGRLTQRPHREPISAEMIDASRLSDDDLDRIFSRRSFKPFDLSKEYPLKITLAIRQENEAFLLLTGHHMFIDATGLNIALGRYLRTYAGLVSGSRPVSVDDGALDYLAYARSQPAEMSGDKVAGKMAYWRNELAGTDPQLHIPGRGADPSFASVSVLGFSLSAQHSAAITGRARQDRVTPFTLIVGAVLAALSEVSDQDEIAIATVTDNRSYKYRLCLGQFADMFLLRGRLARDLDRHRLREISARLSNDLYHRLPSEYVRSNIEWLKRRTESYGISEVVINYLTERATSAGYPQVDGHEISKFQLTHQSDNQRIRYYGVVLGFNIYHRSDGVTSTMTYDTGAMSGGVADTIRAAFKASLCHACGM